jgi:hypothetical protein
MLFQITPFDRSLSLSLTHIWYRRSTAIMKSSLAFAVLVGLTAAAPLEVNKRQVVGTTANDLLNDTTCRAYYLIVARGSTEADNIVSFLTTGYYFRDINSDRAPALARLFALVCRALWVSARSDARVLETHKATLHLF